MPFFSIIIPTYNRSTFISKAISSILEQTFSDFELIIIDDASTDNTQEEVSKFTDIRIQYILNESNLERCNSRNKGISISKGKYICFLDSDDYHLPNHLESLYIEIQKQNNPLALLFTNAWDSNSDELSERYCPNIADFNVFEYISRYTFNPQRMCIHKNIFKDFLFDPEVYVCEDLDLSARIATKFPIIQIQERTTVYVHHASSFTHGDPQKPYKELDNYKRIFAKEILRNKIPKKVKYTLFSMCYFHIARLHEMTQNILQMYIAIIKSFYFCPNGYNGKTNKILLVMSLYNLPVIGWLLKKAKGN